MQECCLRVGESHGRDAAPVLHSTCNVVCPHPPPLPWSSHQRSHDTLCTQISVQLPVTEIEGHDGCRQIMHTVQHPGHASVQHTCNLDPAGPVLHLCRHEHMYHERTALDSIPYASSQGHGSKTACAMACSSLKSGRRGSNQQSPCSQSSETDSLHLCASGCF